MAQQYTRSQLPLLPDDADLHDLRDLCAAIRDLHARHFSAVSLDELGRLAREMAVARLGGQVAEATPAPVPTPVLEPKALANGFVPSVYQQRIFDWILQGAGDGLINAVAGSGKTTTLVQAAQLVGRDAVFCCFNAHIRDELQARLRGTGMAAKTIHQLGLACVSARVGKTNVDGDKYRKLARAYVADELRLAAETGRKAAQALEELAKFARMTLTPAEDREALLGLVAHFGIDLPTDELHGGRKLDTALLEAVPELLAEGVRQAESARHTIDFTDMVWLCWRWNLTPKQVKWAFIDECQDLSAMQLDLVVKLRAPGGRLLFVGDPCQPAGTLVSLPGGKQVPIEELQVGDKVVSYAPRDVAFIMKGRTVSGITKRPYSGELIVAATPDGHVSKYTPNHHCYANFAPLRDRWCVYAMLRGTQWRIGRTKMDYGQAGCGPLARMRAEDADAVWVLQTFGTQEEAMVMEHAIAGKYGIPELMFTPANNSLRLTQELLAQAWEYIGDNYQRGLACLEAYGRNVCYPLFERGQDPWQYSLKRPRVVYAANLLDGALMLPFNGVGNNHVHKADWQPITLTREHYEGFVYSLDVEGDHLYVADGLVTHNCQAIYGFAGADAESFWNIQRRTNATLLPLSICYRCPASHVALAREIVPEIEARPNAPEGIIRSVKEDKLHEEVRDGDLILCRVTAPLVGTCIKLIEKRVPAVVRGKDIAKQLTDLVKTVTEQPRYHWTRFAECLEQYESKQIEKLSARQGTEGQIESLMDRCAAIRTCYDAYDAEDATDLCGRIEALFSDNRAPVVLSTVHKAKGLENPRVYQLRPEKMPLEWQGQQQWELDQEYHLRYVALTRAMEELVWIDG